MAWKYRFKHIEPRIKTVPGRRLADPFALHQSILQSPAEKAITDRHAKARTSPQPSALLLDWYDRHQRRLPWRARPGQVADPYQVWLSEIMLQQTTVAAVREYFLAFTTRWPTVFDLAAANRDDVLAAWAGLGYYARARNLHACAVVIARDHSGNFPDTEEALRKLPGIGPYTAGAIAAIAFDRPAVAVDGNVERVLSRFHLIEEPLPDSKPAVRTFALQHLPSERPGDHAQAMMDLGATICTPKKPKCMMCPWMADCQGLAAGIAEELPRKRPKKPKPTRRGIAFWCVSDDGRVLLRRRADKGLLGGMVEVPSSEWREGPLDRVPVIAEVPAGAFETLPGVVRHTFTHFHLELEVAVASVAREIEPDGLWTGLDNIGDVGLPSVMMKVVKHVLRHQG